MHERWDLRFTHIRYLPRAEGEPQRFHYETPIGFGLTVRGEGESTGTVESERARTSALHFWSEASVSLIRDGRGYWKYLSGEKDGVRFWTWYDYEVRWGTFGALIDTTGFRPLIGWATAWSFDSLRLWAEQGLPPENVRQATLIYTMARWVIVFIWLWHGAVPKLLFPQGDELFLLQAQHLPPQLLPWTGAAEIGFGLLGILLWRWRGYFVVTTILMAAALLAVSLSAPGYVLHAFNPVSLNCATAGLALCGFVAAPMTAFAGRCRRRPGTPGEKGAKA